MGTYTISLYPDAGWTSEGVTLLNEPHPIVLSFQAETDAAALAEIKYLRIATSVPHACFVVPAPDVPGEATRRGRLHLRRMGAEPPALSSWHTEQGLMVLAPAGAAVSDS